MPDSRKLLQVLLVVNLVLLAGCGNGAIQAPSAGTDDPAPTPRFVQPVEVSQNISIVNDNQSTAYFVTVAVVRGEFDRVKFSLESGQQTVTQTKNIRKVGGFKLLHAGRVSDVSPLDATELAQWSTTVRPRSAVSLPLHPERGNVTYFVVYQEEPEMGGTYVYYEEFTCGPESQWMRMKFNVDNESGTLACGG